MLLSLEISMKRKFYACEEVTLCHAYAEHPV